MAFVVIKAETLFNNIDTTALKESIKRHVASRVATYKRLAGGVEFIDSIPRNASGKILRRVLQKNAKSTSGSIN